MGGEWVVVVGGTSGWAACLPLPLLPFLRALHAPPASARWPHHCCLPLLPFLLTSLPARSTTVHLAAPGSRVLSSYSTSRDSYRTSSGTSMATPVVSGAAALLFSAQPDATPQAVRWGGGVWAPAVGKSK